MALYTAIREAIVPRRRNGVRSFFELARIAKYDFRLPAIFVDLARHADALSRSAVSGLPNFPRSSPKMTAVKVALGYGLPTSRNVGCERESAANFADATTPQTVAVSPIWDWRAGWLA